MGTIRHIVEVQAPVDRVFRTWADPLAFSEFFDLIEEIKFDKDSATAQVDYRGAMGGKRSLEFVVTEEVENLTVAWKATSASVPIAGSVALESMGASTFMTFVFSFDPPLVRLGDTISNLLKYPHQSIVEGLERMASALEKS